MRASAMCVCAPGLAAVVGGLKQNKHVPRATLGVALDPWDIIAERELHKQTYN